MERPSTKVSTGWGLVLTSLYPLFPVRIGLPSHTPSFSAYTSHPGGNLVALPILITHKRWNASEIACSTKLKHESRIKTYSDTSLPRAATKLSKNEESQRGEINEEKFVRKGARKTSNTEATATHPRHYVGVGGQ